jgi:hypothetical protein
VVLDLKAVDESAEKKEVEQDLMRGKPDFGWILHDFGPTTSEILKERLEQRFRKVTVMVDTTPRPGAVEVKPKIDSMIVPVKVTLTATAEGSPPITAKGERTHTWSRGHLGWAFPAMAVTFPVGFLWVPPILRSIQEKHEKIAIVEAVDRAATSLAAQLAARPRTAGTPIRVAVATFAQPGGGAR